MREPSARTSRLAIAAAIIAVLGVGGGGFLLGRATAPRPEPAPRPQVAAPAPATRAPAAAPRTWGRTEILDLAARAADAAASGRPFAPETSNAVGQRVDLAIPFGCAGPSSKDSTVPMRWHYDEASGVLRVHVMPESWQARDLGLAGDEGAEVAEGFWISRPWSTDASCPAQTGEASVTPPESRTLSDRTVAIAQFGENDLRPKDRPFEKTLRIAPEELNAAKGFRLRLVGRIGTVAEGGPVRCTQPADVNRRPVCFVGLVLSEVRIENPLDSAPLAIWESRAALHTGQSRR